MSLYFRHAVLEDAAACAEINRPYVEKIVAPIGNTVIGYAYGSPQNTREAYQWNADLAIYLYEEARGKGIGRLLYGCLLDLLTMQGYCRAVGIVTHPNPGIEALHQAIGFS